MRLNPFDGLFGSKSDILNPRWLLTMALRMTPEDVAAVVEAAGFVLSGVVELPPYHYGAIFQKAA
jgi:hypothetical protein